MMSGRARSGSCGQSSGVNLSSKEATDDRECVLARGRPDKSLARFERVALVLSGGGALGAYQAGAYSALEKCGVRPNWIAATAIGAINAAIIAGNLPHERVIRLRQFWRELSKCTATRRPRGPARWARSALTNFLSGGPRPAGRQVGIDEPAVSAAQLRALIAETVDFERINSGTIR